MVQLPSPPALLARAVRLATDGEASASDLAEVIRGDAAVSAEVLRAVNSAYFHFPLRVGSVGRAVTILGQRTTRNLLLCLAIKALARKRVDSPFPLEAFWEGSLRRGAACECLARRLGLPESDEYFTLGICQDIGVLARAQEDAIFAATYGEWMAEAAEVRLKREAQEGESHDRLGWQILETWQMPTELSEAVRFHHCPDEAPEATNSRANVAYAAELLADVLHCQGRAILLKRLRSHLAALGIAEDQCESMFAEVGDRVRAAARMLDVPIGEQPSYSGIFHAASNELVETSLSQRQLSLHLDCVLGEQERLAKRVRELSFQLEARAAIDPLTGLTNERGLLAALEEALALANRQGGTTSLVLLEVDHFERLIGHYGEQAGDRVMAALARALTQVIRRCDRVGHAAARRFALLLPFTDAEGAKIVAERARQLVEKLAILHDNQPLGTTISLGGTSHASGHSPTPEKTVRDARRALKLAQIAGRNCVRWI